MELFISLEKEDIQNKTRSKAYNLAVLTLNYLLFNKQKCPNKEVLRLIYHTCTSQSKRKIYSSFEGAN